MSNIDTIDISRIAFSSAVIPSSEDIRLWDSLSAEQQKAIIMRDLDEAEAGGIAKPQSMAELIAQARAELEDES